MKAAHIILVAGLFLTVSYGAAAQTGPADISPNIPANTANQNLIDNDRARLMERSDEVLAERMIDSRLAAN